MAEELKWPEGNVGRVLGRALPRVDGPDKVSGRAQYGHDKRFSGMVYAAFLTSPVPSATFELDPAVAFEVAGVVDAILVADGAVLYLGEPIAAVAAETPEAAAEAVARLGRAVKLTERPWAVDREQALDKGNKAGLGRQGNVGRERTRKRGDVLAARNTEFPRIAVSLEETYTVPVQHHACLEPHGMVVEYDGRDFARIHGSIQGTFALLDGPPEVLGLPAANIEGNVQHMGGGFGSKFGIGVEGRVACELAKRLKRSVHLFMDRETEFHASGNRSGNHATLRADVAADGRLITLTSDSDKLGGLSGGSYAWHPYMYAPEHSMVSQRSVHTNTDGNRAFRAPGHPQASFSIESLLDEAAYAVGQDLVEMRKRNLPVGDDVDAREVDDHATWHRHLERVATEIGWYEHPNRSAPGSASWLPDRPVAVGIGFGLSVWGGGGYPGNQVEVSLDRYGNVTAKVGTQDIGTGARTLVAMVVAEELGRDVDEIAAQIGSTQLGMGNVSGGSTTTACLVPAVKDAAAGLKRALLAKAADELGVEASTLELRVGGDVGRKDGGVALDWTRACQLLGAAGLTAHGVWQADLQASGVHGAQAAKVEVDLLTGRVQVLEMVCMQDCGLVVNRLTAQSQVQGAMVQALSYALFEERLIDSDLGARLNPNLEAYKLATMQSMPEMKVIFDDEDQRGVIGLGEPPAIPGAAAIANAVHNACGVRIRDLPLTPDKVLMGLEALRS